MGFAYTPGLTVAEDTVVRLERRLPIKGEILVEPGQEVKAEDVVAQTDLPGPVHPVNVVGKLGIDAADLPKLLLKHEGDRVSADEVYIRTRGFFGLFKSELKAPLDGAIESVSSITGQVIFRGNPTPLQKLAYAAGKVVAVEAEESVTTEVRGTFIQGIFGVGGETRGELVIAVDGPADVLDADAITEAHRGKVLVGGCLVTAAAVKRAIDVGVAGIVAGGVNDADLREFLGYELGVAITGEEELGVTIVVTEGFGKIRMAEATFALLTKRAGRIASMNGATQIRAGVIRPEVIIPLGEDEPRAGDSDASDEMAGVLQIGTQIRAIREPYFGRIGTCKALPAELKRLSSETMVRVLEVEFADGERVTLPRANVELIKAT